MSHTRLAALTLALAACSSPRLAAAHGDWTAHSGPYSLEVIDGAGRRLPTFQHRGRTYVLGSQGARYMLRIRNQTGGRIEVVASVDGRDVIDGRPAATSKPGYLVQPWGQVVIDGFRLSHESVAAFRFSTVEGSYAAQMGDARDVGVIGAAVFTEAPPPPPPPRPLYRSPYYDDELSDGRDRFGAGGAGGEAKSAEQPSAEPPASAAEGSRSADSGPARKRERLGLGTGFGESHESHVMEVQFERSSTSPAAMLAVRYNDRQGLLALGIDVDGWRTSARERWMRESAQPFRNDGFSEPPPGWPGR